MKCSTRQQHRRSGGSRQQGQASRGTAQPAQRRKTHTPVGCPPAPRPPTAAPSWRQRWRCCAALGRCGSLRAGRGGLVGLESGSLWRPGQQEGNAAGGGAPSNCDSAILQLHLLLQIHDAPHLIACCQPPCHWTSPPAARTHAVRHRLLLGSVAGVALHAGGGADQVVPLLGGGRGAEQSLVGRVAGGLRAQMNAVHGRLWLAAGGSGWQALAGAPPGRSGGPRTGC